ncbi:hypothetical protein Agub_g5910 [Astrephomene gubernaculifera]|uniref:Uncharacterized protein n=1 Tax=Astrephomene gubernaculifera TaxID=47775 RepID=A0AAD3DQ66_9CHLO|nr:hypothetical protein Agub_g5910 [Astrephomene gubernaculifera]
MDGASPRLSHALLSLHHAQSMSPMASPRIGMSPRTQAKTMEKPLDLVQQHMQRFEECLQEPDLPSVHATRQKNARNAGEAYSPMSKGSTDAHANQAFTPGSTERRSGAVEGASPHGALPPPVRPELLEARACKSLTLGEYMAKLDRAFRRAKAASSTPHNNRNNSSDPLSVDSGAGGGGERKLNRPNAPAFTSDIAELRGSRRLRQYIRRRKRKGVTPLDLLTDIAEGQELLRRYQEHQQHSRLAAAGSVEADEELLDHSVDSSIILAAAASAAAAAAAAAVNAVVDSAAVAAAAPGGSSAASATANNPLQGTTASLLSGFGFPENLLTTGFEPALPTPSGSASASEAGDGGQQQPRYRALPYTPRLGPLSALRTADMKAAEFRKTERLIKARRKAKEQQQQQQQQQLMMMDDGSIVSRPCTPISEQQQQQQPNLKTDANSSNGHNTNPAAAGAATATAAGAKRVLQWPVGPGGSSSSVGSTRSLRGATASGATATAAASLANGAGAGSSSRNLASQAAGGWRRDASAASSSPTRPSWTRSRSWTTTAAADPSVTSVTSAAAAAAAAGGGDSANSTPRTEITHSHPLYTTSSRSLAAIPERMSPQRFRTTAAAAAAAAASASASVKFPAEEVLTAQGSLGSGRSPRTASPAQQPGLRRRATIADAVVGLPAVRRQQQQMGCAAVGGGNRGEGDYAASVAASDVSSIRSSRSGRSLVADWAAAAVAAANAAAAAEDPDFVDRSPLVDVSASGDAADVALMRSRYSPSPAPSSSSAVFHLASSRSSPRVAVQTAAAAHAAGGDDSASAPLVPTTPVLGHGANNTTSAALLPPPPPGSMPRSSSTTASPLMLLTEAELAAARARAPVLPPNATAVSSSPALFPAAAAAAAVAFREKKSGQDNFGIEADPASVPFSPPLDGSSFPSPSPSPRATASLPPRPPASPRAAGDGGPQAGQNAGLGRPPRRNMYGSGYGSSNSYSGGSISSSASSSSLVSIQASGNSSSSGCSVVTSNSSCGSISACNSISGGSSSSSLYSSGCSSGRSAVSSSNSLVSSNSTYSGIGRRIKVSEPPSEAPAAKPGAGLADLAAATAAAMTATPPPIGHPSPLRRAISERLRMAANAAAVKNAKQQQQQQLQQQGQGGLQPQETLLQRQHRHILSLQPALSSLSLASPDASTAAASGPYGGGDARVDVVIVRGRSGGGSYSGSCNNSGTGTVGAAEKARLIRRRTAGDVLVGARKASAAVVGDADLIGFDGSEGPFVLGRTAGRAAVGLVPAENRVTSVWEY